MLKINFIIGASLDSSISDVNRCYLEKLITNKQARKHLVKELETVKKQAEKLGKRQIKRQENFNKLLEKCEKIKGRAWCEVKLKPRLNKIIYRLNEINKKLIEVQLKAIIKQLEQFYKKQWISEKGYEIIKEDINWLINKLKEGGEII